MSGFSRKWPFLRKQEQGREKEVIKQLKEGPCGGIPEKEKLGVKWSCSGCVPDQAKLVDDVESLTSFVSGTRK